jgi:hypothetical protein
MKPETAAAPLTFHTAPIVVLEFAEFLSLAQAAGRIGGSAPIELEGAA